MDSDKFMNITISVAVVVLIIALIWLGVTGASGKTDFSRAQIKSFDGEIIMVYVKSVIISGSSVTVESIDGQKYLTDLKNVVLIKD